MSSIYVVIMESDDCQGLEWVGSLPVGYTPNVGRPGHQTTNWSIATLQEDLESSSVVHCGSGIWKWGGSWEVMQRPRQGELLENVLLGNIFCLCLI